MKPQQRAEIYLLLVTVIWGSTFVITKSIIGDNSPFAYTAIRFLLSALLLLPFAFRRLTHIPRSTIVKGSVLGILLYGGFILQTIGIQYTTASKSAFFTGMLVVLTPVIHFLAPRFFPLPHKILKAGNIAGVACAAAGLYLLTLPQGAAFTVGDGMTLGCALLFAIYIVYLDYASTEPDKLQLTFVQFVVCGGIGIVPVLLTGDVRIDWSQGFLFALTYLTVFATIISMWVQNRFQGDTTPTRAAVIFSMEPVVAALFAYGIRGEQIGIPGVVGASFMLTGLLVSEFSENIPFLRKEFSIKVPAGVDR